MFKSHLEMIGRNETPSKKAKFWQSFVRSLKGSEDIRAHETPRPLSLYRPYSGYVDYPTTWKSIFDEPATPAERIHSHGYRYLPVHRETYGYSPRPIYDHHYSRSIPSARADIERAWNEHLKRMAEIERRYPSRYGLYLKDKPNALVPLEYEPEDKPLFSEYARAPSVPSRFSRSPSPFDRARSVPVFDRAGSLEPNPLSRLRASSLEPLERALASKFDVPLNLVPRSMSPTPIKPGRWAPRSSEVAYDNEGLPIYHPALRRSNFGKLLNPSPYLPISAITRDPWWWDLEDLHPYRARLPYSNLSPLIRESYLSPVRRNYLWGTHPLRPLYVRKHYF